MQQQSGNRSDFLRGILCLTGIFLTGCALQPTPDTQHSAQAGTQAINIRAIARQSVSPSQPSKTRRNYGTILMRDKTPETASHTRVILSDCIHPQSGQVNCNTYLFPIDDSGELQSPVKLEQGKNAALILAEGTYYMKSGNLNSDYLVSGQIRLKPKATHYIRLVFE
ncbi:hypothetical protein [Aliamphritea hakodatensis]|uniref:hypothetical protein n=1 Tax=Aliamphritea hakodatensis TaxID=2895352 RepID=UPI0022FD49F4|nr:hypothetical protein [Aliamphritea hakodatensis]